MATAFIANVNTLVSQAKAAGCDSGTARVALCSVGSSTIVGLVYNE